MGCGLSTASLFQGLDVYVNIHYILYYYSTLVCLTPLHSIIVLVLYIPLNPTGGLISSAI